MFEKWVYFGVDLGLINLRKGLRIARSEGFEDLVGFCILSLGGMLRQGWRISAEKGVGEYLKFGNILNSETLKIV